MTFAEFKNTYEHVLVEEYPHQISEAPMVSVCVHSYNHGDYIKQCLDSILNQNTTFPFEILLGEDNSSDNTREICIEYAKKHPNKIRLFLHHRENNIKIDRRPTGKFNFLYNFFNTNGKYIALCEGDDYWCESNKLQKQFEFMEQNEKVSFVYHDSFQFIQEEGVLKDIFLPVRIEDSGIVPKELIFKNLGGAYPTASSFFRTEIINEIPDYFFIFPVGDSPLILRAMEYGEIAFLNEKWSVYRTTQTNWSSGQKVLAHKESHFKTSMLGIEKFQEMTQGLFKKCVRITKSHLTYQLLYFYLTLKKPFSDKLKYMLRHFGKLSVKDKAKILYRFIQFSLS